VGLVRTDVSEVCVASIFRVGRICELGTVLAVTIRQRRNTNYMRKERRKGYMRNE
jgi:hypothetical protein